MNSLNKQSDSNSLVIEQLVTSVSQVVLGKQIQVKLALACLLANGHLLIEDLPGMGKTTLAHAIADVLNLDYKRVQFTSDLLPADLLGMSVFNAQKTEFEFHQGPIFTQLLLADEINRTSAKTQSALLEAMEEAQVSIDGKTRSLSSPFFVIATQNPQNHSGTYELPESQLDRFLMRIKLGYPSYEAERILLRTLASGKVTRRKREKLTGIIDHDQLKELQGKASNVSVSEHLLDYLQRLINFTRESEFFSLGLSPRGSIALLSAAKAWALIEGRDFALPEDIQQVFPAVAGHRLKAGATTGDYSLNDNGEGLSEFVLKSVDVVYS